MRNRVQRTRAPSSCQWIFHGIEVKWCRKSSHLYLYATASDLIIADTRLDFSINATTNHPSILSIVNRVRISHSNVSTTIYFSFPTKLLLYLREIKILSVPIYWIYFFCDFIHKSIESLMDRIARFFVEKIHFRALTIFSQIKHFVCRLIVIENWLPKMVLWNHNHVHSQNVDFQFSLVDCSVKLIGC